MRYGVPITLSSLILCGLTLQAQERIAAPPPDPGPPLVQGQPPTIPTIPTLPPVPQGPVLQPPSGTNTQPGPGPYGPNGQYPPPPYPPYGPNGPYPPPYPPPGWVPPPPGWAPPPPGWAPPLVFSTDIGSDPRFWLGAEALVWWNNRQPLPVPLITTGPASAGSNPGGIGVPGTVSLDSPLNYGAVGGVRLFGGGWLDAGHTWGIDSSIIILGEGGASFSAGDKSGTGAFVINEPVAGAPFSTVVSAPGIDTGFVNVTSGSQFFSYDLNLMYNLFRNSNWSVTLLGGFRYLELDEWINITANSTLFTTTTYTDNFGNVLATAPPGSGVSVIDQFNTHNEFYGGQVGARVNYSWNRFTFEGTGFLAIGGVHQSVNVNGSTVVFPTNGPPVPMTGGNYATQQIGHYWQDRFAVAPEFRMNVGYQITPHLRATLGYDLIYLSSVLRPGNQIDNTFDGVVHPLVPMKTSGFWTQGLTLGLQFNF